MALHTCLDQAPHNNKFWPSLRYLRAQSYVREHGFRFVSELEMGISVPRDRSSSGTSCPSSTEGSPAYLFCLSPLHSPGSTNNQEKALLEQHRYTHTSSDLQPNQQYGTRNQRTLQSKYTVFTRKLSCFSAFTIVTCNLSYIWKTAIKKNNLTTFSKKANAQIWQLLKGYQNVFCGCRSNYTRIFHLRFT